MKLFKLSSFLILLTILGSSAVMAQDLEPATVKNIIQSKNFIFKAEYVNPQSGSTRPLTSEYDVSVKSDKVVSYLPFFGRAYTAPVNPAEGGIKFTSLKFDYTIKQKNKKWDVRIRPRDVSDVQDMYLTVFDNGKASLRVISTNRQSISYDGYIIESKQEKKAF
jgi:hypothetical protein